MNQMMISGRVTGDVVERTSNGGKKYVTFNIAWNKKGKEGNDKVLFFQVSAFGNTAEFAKNYLKKGSPVEVTGELDSSITEKDGHHYLNNRIMANTVGFYGFPMKHNNEQEA